MNGHIVAAETPLSVNGKTYTLTSLTMRSLRELEKTFQNQAIAEAKENIVGLAVEIAIPILQKLLDDAKRIQLGSDEFTEKMQTISGMATILSIAMRKYHNDMSPDRCINLLTPKNMEAISAAVTEISGMSGGDADFTKTETVSVPAQ